MSISVDQLNRLKSQLLTSGISQSNNALYQVVNELIGTLTGIVNEINSTLTPSSGGGGLGDQSFITVNNDTPTLPNSSQLIAGQGVTLNKQKNRIVINVSISQLMREKLDDEIIIRRALNLVNNVPDIFSGDNHFDITNFFRPEIDLCITDPTDGKVVGLYVVYVSPDIFVTVPGFLTVDNDADIYGDITLKTNNKFLKGTNTSAITKSLIGLDSSDLVNIDADGLGSLFGGSVGIGIVPVSKLQLLAASNRGIQLGNTAGSDTDATSFTDLVTLGVVINLERTVGGFTNSIFSYRGASDENVGLIARKDIAFATGDTPDAVRIKADGKFGIGTITPSSQLAVVGLPTSSAGLAAGDVWEDTTGALNILKII